MSIINIKNKFLKSNVIYKITRNLDLESSTLTIPSGCTLDFQGGSISNGTITLDNTKILPQGCNIADYITATISGTYKEGQMLYDSSLKKMKLWNGTDWVNLDGTALIGAYSLLLEEVPANQDKTN